MNFQMADRLIELRKKHGYSQEDLADMLGISRQAISKWERAESSPDTENLIALSKLYKVTLDELVNGEKEKIEREGNEYYGGLYLFRVSPQKALKITGFIFLGLGLMFLILGTGFYLGFSVPENRDYKIANDENLVPISAKVIEVRKTNIVTNAEYQYRVVFSWDEDGFKRISSSNPAYSETEANALLDTNVLIRADKEKTVLVNYQRSVYSVLGNIFFGVFGGLGVVFTVTFTVLLSASKNKTQKKYRR